MVDFLKTPPSVSVAVMVKPLVNVVAGSTTHTSVAVSAVVPSTMPLPQSSITASVAASAIVKVGVLPKLMLRVASPASFSPLLPFTSMLLRAAPSAL